MSVQIMVNWLVIGLGSLLTANAIGKRSDMGFLSNYFVSQGWFIWSLCLLFSCIFIFSIEVVLLSCVGGSTLIYGWEKLVGCKRRQAGAKPNEFVYQVCDLFPLLLLVWLGRSFVIQPYRVPTGSLEPTVLPGDFLLVNQYTYGLRMPVFRTLLWPISKPKRGDIAVFYPPQHPDIHYVKRVVGLPGDRISYRHKTFYINGKEASQHVLGVGYAVDPGEPVVMSEEQLGQVKHKIFTFPEAANRMDHTWVVPAHNYFMVGDNRDFSNDSRFWGFVPERNLVGRVILVWLSWNHDAWVKGDYLHLIRWQRIGDRIH